MAVSPTCSWSEVAAGWGLLQAAKAKSATAAVLSTMEEVGFVRCRTPTGRLRPSEHRVGESRENSPRLHVAELAQRQRRAADVLQAAWEDTAANVSDARPAVIPGAWQTHPVIQCAPRRGRQCVAACSAARFACAEQRALAGRRRPRTRATSWDTGECRPTPSGQAARALLFSL